jgi:hypothetical protein
MDAENKDFVQFNENSHVFEFAIYSHELVIKFKKKKLFATFLHYFFHDVSGNTTFFFVWPYV